MKTKIFTLALFASLLSSQTFAQDRTTVSANSSEISDNLDLKAVASIFGDSENLEDFERRLNDPKTQISNLDLNNDNQVDYLRVIESVEDRTHLIIVQAVLERDVFQDVATIEVEKDDNNRVQIQVVGDVYMYGNNYIYEPIYVHTPIIYASFWIGNYRPYYSSWYWGYYPTYYYAWHPYPIYRYRRNIGLCINVHHHYNYVNIRRSHRAIAMHGTRRANAYEVQHPDRSFNQRNTRISNRYELDQTRATRNVNRRNEVTSSRGNRRNDATAPRGNRNETTAPRGNRRSEASTPRGNRYETTSPRVNTRSQSSTPRGNRNETSTQRRNSRTEASTQQGNRNESATPRVNNRRDVSTQRGNQQQRNQANRGDNQSRGSKRD